MTDPTRREFLGLAAGATATLTIAPELLFARPRPQAAPLRVGVIGIGRQGRDILDELLKIDNVEIAALCDVVPTRLSAGAERAPQAARYAEHGALLTEARDLGAIVVATPTHTHREIATAALLAGHHVYCEAPLAHTVDDARAIAAAASSAGKLLQPGLLAPANPLWQRARALARSDSVRSVAAMYAQDHRKTSWRFPAASPALERAANWRLDPDLSLGIEGEFGSHQLAALAWLRSRPPQRIRGHGTISLHDDGRSLPDTVLLEVLWEDGTAAAWSGTLANSFGGRHEIVYGSMGAIRLADTHAWMFKEADAPTQGWEVYAARQQFHRDEGIILIADATRLAAQGQLREGAGLPFPPLYYALVEFVKSIDEARASA
ncbi:MAG TPA: Gfo/Idh/MocA family oxidoreductase, partial [Longimicrobiales bacterium]|nr:Gfo/Idh/MocA family oxidoreductase [Longimicrobiales bacterium]